MNEIDLICGALIRDFDRDRYKRNQSDYDIIARERASRLITTILKTTGEDMQDDAICWIEKAPICKSLLFG